MSNRKNQCTTPCAKMTKKFRNKRKAASYDLRSKLLWRVVKIPASATKTCNRQISKPETRSSSIQTKLWLKSQVLTLRSPLFTSAPRPALASESCSSNTCSAASNPCSEKLKSLHCSKLKGKIKVINQH